MVYAAAALEGTLGIPSDTQVAASVRIGLLQIQYIHAAKTCVCSDYINVRLKECAAVS
jgi:hypothetical protein